MRVVAAMSGGVDSAVAAARMVRAGHDVVGVHLALAGGRSGPAASGGCCSLEDSADARRVADRLGIPFYVWDMSTEFRAEVIDDFVAEYAAGRTPNPCLRCNERIKFSALLDKARAFGFDAVATGHYARIVEAGGSASGERELHRATDLSKDQSYVLGVLTADQLAGAEFPLGASLKPEIRREARELGFAVADKPDSHDLCFVGSGETRVWLGTRLGTRSGSIVEQDGTVVGTHHGAFAFTVGQRKGLDIHRPAADGRPRYVLQVDVPQNTVVVGPAEALEIDVVVGDQARWCGRPPGPAVEVGVQMRAHGQEFPATARRRGPQVEVELHSPTRGVAAGQRLVLYSGTRVVGSAVITRTRKLGGA